VRELMSRISISFKKLTDQAIIPKFADDHAAAMDFFSSEDSIIPPKEFKPVATGIAWQPNIEFTKKVYMKIEGRSGNAIKYGIDVLGGVIDENYTGEIKVILMNNGNNPFVIKKGDRIAQGIVHVIPRLKITEVLELEDTERGSNGFGSTGR
jgi:dUTP pyrophosphatase